MYYTWDLWLLSESTPGFKLKAVGTTDVAPSSDCQDGSCAGFKNGTYLEMPPHNFGDYPALSFSFWFKPTSESGSDATIIDFGGHNQGKILIARKGTTKDLVFTVSHSQSRTSSAIAIGVWTSQWKHVVWTLSPMGTGSNSVWQIYIDGTWLFRLAGLFPINAVLSSNYFGKSNADADEGFVGFIDSFYIFQAALSGDQVSSMYAVRAKSQP